jgi:hypothetical protein
MGMEAADPVLKIKTAAVIAGQLFWVSRSPLGHSLSISAFGAKFGLRVIWLSAVRGLDGEHQVFHHRPNLWA